MEKRLVQVDFQGLDTKSPKGMRPLGTLDVVENYYYLKGSDGGLELRKRLGSTTLGRAISSNLSTITAGKRLEVVGDALYQLCTLSNWRYDKIVGYNSVSGQWDDIRSVANFASSTTPITVDSGVATGGYKYVDGAYGGGYAAFVYTEVPLSNGFSYRVLDYATGRQITSEVTLSAGGTGFSRGLRIVYSGTKFLIFYIDNANNFKVYSFDPAQPGFATGPVTIGAVVAGGLFDVQKIATDSLLLAWRPAAGNVTIMKWTSALVAGTNTTTAIAANQAIGWVERDDFSDGNAYLLVTDSVSGTRMYSMTQTLVTPALHSTVSAGATSATSITGYHTTASAEFTAMWSINTGNAEDATTLYAQYSAGWAAALTYYGVTVATKPALVGGQWHWLASYETNSTATTTQNTYFLFAGRDSFGGSPPSYSAVRVVHLPGEAGGHLPMDMTIPGAWTIDSTHVMFPTRRRARLISNGASAQFASRGAQMLVVDSNPTSISAAATLARSAVMPGSIVRSLWTNDAPALGFAIGPEKPALVVSAGGSLTVGGTYSYVLAVERYMPNGERCFSVISEPTSITITGTNRTVSVNSSTLRVDPSYAEGATARVRIFRTASNQQLYYRASVNDSFAVGVAGGGSMGGLDDIADTTLVNNEPLYTDGDPGELDSEAPPASRVACVWKNRVWLAGCERDDEIWASKEIQRDVGIGFSKGLVVRIERDGGDVTALVPLEDRLLVLKRASAYYISGDGPDAAGQGTFWSITKLPLQVGTVYPRSVVQFAGGVIFKSQQGFFLLSRGLEPTYIGAPVEDWNSDDCTGAVVEEDKSHIRFFSTSGRELVYNWLFNKWSTYTGHPAVAACKWMNKVTWLASDGTVWQDSTSLYTDNGSAYTASWSMNFASFAGIEGFQRISAVTVYGESLSASAFLNMGYAIDDGGTIEGFQSGLNPRALEFQPRRRRCTSVRLTSTDSTTNAGFAFRAISFYVGVMAGGDRNLSTTARKGPS